MLVGESWPVRDPADTMYYDGAWGETMDECLVLPAPWGSQLHTYLP
jgi:hypothetical protein